MHQRNCRDEVAFVVIGDLEDRRITFFKQALEKEEVRNVFCIGYHTLVKKELEGEEIDWAMIMPQKTKFKEFYVRLDSPGGNFFLEKSFIILGAKLRRSEVDSDECCGYISEEEAHKLQFDKGRILQPRQWYLGFTFCLQKWYREINAHFEWDLIEAKKHWMQYIPDICTMFDKCATHTYLHELNIPQPQAWLGVKSYGDLQQVLRRNSIERVFIKMAHGSSASGVVAYFCSSQQEYAITSVELVRTLSGIKLFNSLKVRKYTNRADITAIINFLCGQKAIVEEWLPKFKHQERVGDLRVVIIGGEPQHWVVRTSRTPMTNLHLGNARGDSKSFLEECGTEHWAEVKKLCREVGRCFGDSFYAGLDILVTPDYQKQFVLEVNAFGDLIPRILHDGRNTYEAELYCFLRRNN